MKTIKFIFPFIFLALCGVLKAQTTTTLPKFETKILFMQVWDGSNTTYPAGIVIEDGNFGEFSIELETVKGKKQVVSNAKIISNVFNQLLEQGYVLCDTKFNYNADVTGNSFVADRSSYIFKKE